MKKKRVLCFASYFLPGFRAGGPIRSLQRTIEALGEDFDFRVVTRDRDAETNEPYPGQIHDRWCEVSGIRIWYLRPPFWAPAALRRVIADYRPDLLYFHSFLDPSLVAMPLMLARIGLVPQEIPKLVAPRGEFAPSALALKRRKKSTWMLLARNFGLYRTVTWQATNQQEAAYIREHWGQRARILIAPNLPPLVGATKTPSRRVKQAGMLRIVFLSRISPMKNLVGALRMLAMVNTPMTLDIYGPQVSAEYWAECNTILLQLPPHVTATYRDTVMPDQTISVISSYDLFFLPTLGENFGHVILEALLAGCPVLISDRTPWRHLQEKRAGFELTLDKPEAFVEALERFAAMDQPEFQEWSDGAARLGRAYSVDETLRQEARGALCAAMSEPP